MPIQEVNNPWLHELPDNTVDGDTDKKIVIRALQTIKEGYNINENRRTELELIEDNNDAAFSVAEPFGNEFMESKLAYNTQKKAFERLKFLEFDLATFPKKFDEELEKQVREKQTSQFLKENPDATIDQANEDYLANYEENRRFKESIAKKGIQYVMEKAGLSRVLRNSPDNSAFWDIVSLGDAFIMVSANEDGDFPIKYERVDWKNIFVMSGDKAIRGSSSGRNSQRIAIVFKYDYDEYIEEVANKLEGKNKTRAMEAQWGALPELTNEIDNQHRELYSLKTSDNEQGSNRWGQLCLYIDLEMEECAWIVGGKATMIKHFKKSEFPFKKDNSPFIPLVHMKGLYKDPRSIHHLSVGHYMAQDNETDRIIRNEKIAGTINEINPIRYMRVASQTGAKRVQGLLYQAQQDRIQGHEPIVIDHADEDGNFSMNPIENLSGGTTAQAGDIIKSIVDEDVRRLGVSIDAAETPASKTATAIASEDEEANALARNLGMINEPEMKFLIEITIERIIELVSVNDKTTFDTSDIEVSTPAQLKVLRKSSNLGALKDFLSKNHVHVKMRAMTGAIPNVSTQIALYNGAYQAAAGTPMGSKIMQRLMNQFGFYPSMRDITPAQPEQQTEAQQTPEQANPASMNEKMI